MRKQKKQKRILPRIAQKGVTSPCIYNIINPMSNGVFIGDVWCELPEDVVLPRFTQKQVKVSVQQVLDLCMPESYDKLEACRGTYIGDVWCPIKPVPSKYIYAWLLLRDIHQWSINTNEHIGFYAFNWADLTEAEELLNTIA